MIRRIGNQRKQRNHSDYRIFKISENSEKSPGNLKRLPGNQNPRKGNQRSKTHLVINNNNSNKWKMHKPETVLEIKAQKILLGFMIKTDHPIPVRNPDQ